MNEQELEIQVEETPEVQPTPEQIAAQRVQSAQELNFRELRKKNEETERRLKAAEQLLEEERMRSRYQQPPAPKEHSLDDDDIADVGYVKRELAKVQAELRAERERQESERQQYQQQAAINRIASAYPDYQEILSDRNMELLRTLEPELYETIEAMPDVYKKGVAAIKAVKAFGVVGQDKYAKEKEAIQKQSARPKSANSINTSPSNSALNQAHAFTGVMDDSERQRVYDEAVRRSRGM